MTREELLGWIGVLLGLPGVLILFLGGHIAVAALVLVLVAAFVWFAWRFNKPTFTILEVHKILNFVSPDGASATLVRTQKARANHPASEFWFRGMGSDGRIENIRIDGAAPARILRELGEIHACKQYAHPLRSGTVSIVRLEYELLDSFPAAQESLLHTVFEPTGQLRLEVHFHSGRPCRSAKLFRRYGGGERTLDIVDRSEDGVLASAIVKHPKVGSQYELEWEW